ncbi:DMT family transporter [Dyadobacter bucti]|jgi:small multidrug resistance pump|uniref:DMT family transporter n=1 Tax=Dyadobacter bucti TaxID=2572203 RepID=UPI001109FC2E|nr:multidrug efflux SMR transporter [Dyadobacter bucti]
MKNWIFLLIAIVSETIATSALKSSEGFSKVLPGIVVVAGYAVAFYFLSLTLKTIPVGIAYAIWSGVGIVLITMVGIIIYKQIPDLPGIIGILLIISGVIVINVFSKISAH